MIFSNINKEGAIVVASSELGTFNEIINISNIKKGFSNITNSMFF